MELQQLQSKFDSLQGRRDNLKKWEKEYKQECVDLKNEIEDYNKAKAVIQEASRLTQEKLQVHIDKLVTTALNSIFGKSYKFKTEFVNRRNKSECDLYLEDDKGERFDVLSSTGGGVVDIVSFALQISIWGLTDKKNHIILLDEPFRFLSNDLQKEASNLLKLLVDKLKLQFVIVSHEEGIIEEADKIYQTRMENGKTKLSDTDNKSEEREEGNQ